MSFPISLPKISFQPAAKGAPRARIDRRFATGGNSNIHQGTTPDGQPVVYKIFRLPQGQPATHTEFECLAYDRLAAFGGHPHVIKAVGLVVGKDNKLPRGVAVEQLNKSLTQQLQEQGPLPLRDALQVLSHAIKGLQYAKQCGLQSHNDLKPDNIMFREASQEWVVNDFGLAILPIGLDLAYGTPEYMSPEAHNGRPLDERSDIYSLSVIMYEMLTGHCPFEASSGADAVARHSKARALKEQVGLPVLPRVTENDGVQGRLEQLLVKMVDIDPAGRHQSLDELAKEVESIRRDLLCYEKCEELKRDHQVQPIDLEVVSDAEIDALFQPIIQS